MNRDHVDQVLTDFTALGAAGIGPELQAIKTALMLEDVFDVRLSDGVIDAAHLADTAAVKGLLDRAAGER